MPGFALAQKKKSLMHKTQAFFLMPALGPVKATNYSA
jgi:hypothetical protein